MSQNPVPNKREIKREKLFESTKKVVRYINRVHGLRYRLVERFLGGYDSGAYLLQASAGEKAVLKWNNRKHFATKMGQAATAIKLARGFGWPTPDWIVWGVTPSGYPYQVQEFVEGAHRPTVDMILVKDALRVIDLQAGKAPAMDQNWTKFDREVAYEDHTGAFKKIAEYSKSGEVLIDILNKKLEPFRNNVIPDNDIVHGDFHSENALMRGDRIIGLIDAESIGRGSRFHDIATLVTFIMLFDGDPATLQPLVLYARAHAVPGEFEICLAANLANVLSLFCRKLSETGESKISAAEEFIQSIL
jgi:aminoglycoside phosphotransferase (APT) family kinase protein